MWLMSRFTLHLVWFRLNILENKDINIPGNEMLNINLTIGSSNVQIIFESWTVTTESQRRKSDSLQLLVLLAPLQSISLVLLRLEIMVRPVRSVQYHQLPLTRFIRNRKVVWSLDFDFLSWFDFVKICWVISIGGAVSSWPVMAQTNLVVKVLLCLLVPAYQALQQAQTAGSTSSFSFLRYWLVLSSLFLSELFLDQLNLSPMFFLLKLAFMLWFVAPVEYNGSHLLHEQVGW